MKNENIKRLTLDIPETLHTALKIEATRQGTSMNALLQTWIKEHLRRAKG